METAIIACLTCAKNFADDGPNAAGWSILFMLGVVLLMMGTIAFLMVRLARRPAADLEPEFDADRLPESR